MKKLLTLMICSLLLVGCTSKATTIEEPSPSPTASSDSTGACAMDSDCGTDTKTIEYYDSVITDGNFINTQMSELVTMLKNKETFVVYLGASSCPWCQEALPIMDELANKYDIKYIYVDSRPTCDDRTCDIRVDTNPDYVELQTLLEALTTEEDRKIYIPTVATIVNGEVTSFNVGTVDSHDAHERKMTDEEANQLTAIYDEMLSNLIVK